MNTSILEILCWPLKVLFGYDVRQPSIFEHALTPLVVVTVLRWLPLTWSWVGFAILVIMHLVVKELIVDVIKHGEINWPNVIERVYGLILGAIILWIR